MGKRRRTKQPVASSSAAVRFSRVVSLRNGLSRFILVSASADVPEGTRAVEDETAREDRAATLGSNCKVTKRLSRRAYKNKQRKDVHRRDRQRRARELASAGGDRIARLLSLSRVCGAGERLDGAAPRLCSFNHARAV
jgi:hypothetical protein